MERRADLHRFFVDSRIESAGSISLTREQAKQLSTVLRLRAGDELIVFDGTGIEAVGTIVELRRTGATVAISGEVYSGIRPVSPRVHLGVALLKADRFDLVIQKATELGVARITPIQSERCVVSLPADRLPARMARWRRIAIEALEQSGRSDDITIDQPIFLRSFAESVTCDRKLIAWENETIQRLSSLIDPDLESVSVLVGPEGGFSSLEVELAVAQGFRSVRLAPMILRSETAAIALPAMIMALAERGTHEE
jgi:16S rRNA (uracil1498-N3)-methyltransferase